MKKTWSKKAIGSVIVAITLVATGGYFVSKKMLKRAKPQHSAQQRQKRGDVQGATFQGVSHELRSCYESLLIRNPTIDDGKVLFHIMLSNTGGVSFLKLIHSDFEEDQFQECITEKVKEMRSSVDSDRVGVLIAHTFKFHRKDEGQIDF